MQTKSWQGFTQTKGIVMQTKSWQGFTQTKGILCKPSRDKDSRKSRALLCKSKLWQGLIQTKGIYANRTDICGNPNIELVQYSSRKEGKRNKARKRTKIGQRTRIVQIAGRLIKFLLHIFIQDLLIFFYKSIHTIKFCATFVVIILADSVKIQRNKLHCSAPNININMYCVFLLYIY